jgi:cardiolipin synthase (CMP-forming)
VATPEHVVGEQGLRATREPIGAVQPGADRVLTVPNLITLGRLLCLPVYLWLLLGLDDRLAAAGLLAVLGATDWADGYVARHFNQESELGRILDPVADRLLFFVAIGGILVVDGAPRWFALVVLVREALVGATAVVLALLGASRIDVTWFGKAGTFGLMFAFPLFLAGSSDSEMAPVFENLAWVAAIPGLMFSLYAAVLYVPIARRAYREGRARRRSVSAGGATG